MRFIDKMEQKLGRFAIPRLMIFITVAYLVGYIMYYVGATNILAAERTMHIINNLYIVLYISLINMSLQPN